MSRQTLHKCVICCAAAIAAVYSLHPVVAADYTIAESPTDRRTFQITQSLTVSGTLKAPKPGGETISLKLKATAEHAFIERRLAGRGRDAKALRVVRSYERADTDVTVDKRRQIKQLTTPLIVMQGDDAGLTPYSPTKPLSFSDREVLQMPGDVLTWQAFFPPGKVSIGDTWTPPGWAVQLLTGIDAVGKTDVTCKLKSVTGDRATVTIEGKTEGAHDGAPTNIAFSGHYEFDLKKRFLTSARIEQSEMSKPGPISPALEVKANVTVKRKVADSSGSLTSDVVAGIELEPKSELLKVHLAPTAQCEFAIDHNWHVVFQDKRMTILRLLERGNLIAQVNIKPLEKARPGKHVSERQFQADIRESLGEQLQKLVRAERIEPKDRRDGRDLLRVIAEGKGNGIEMRWIYYRCAAPDGRQVSLVFAVEKKLLKQFGERDIGFVLSVRFPEAE